MHFVQENVVVVYSLYIDIHVYFILIFFLIQVYIECMKKKLKLNIKRISYKEKKKKLMECGWRSGILLLVLLYFFLCRYTFIYMYINISSIYILYMYILMDGFTGN